MFYSWFLFSKLIWFVFWAHLSSKYWFGVSEGAGTLCAVDCSKNICTSPSLHLSDFVFDSWFWRSFVFTALWSHGKHANGNIFWDVWLPSNSYTAVGTEQKRWWDGSVLGALNFHKVMPDVDIPFERCSEDVNYEKVCGKPVAATRELALLELFPTTEVVSFQRVWTGLACLPGRTYWGDCKISSIWCVLQIGNLYFVRILFMYMTCRGKD